MKKLLSILLVLTALLALVSCGGVKPKDFSSSGMTITLTNKFTENTQQGYTVCYDSADVAVFVLKESFSLQEGLEDMTLNEYATLVRSANSARNPSAVSKKNDLVSIEYTFYNESEGRSYKYFSTMFKGPDAFWLVQFACLEDAYDAHLDSFIGWAQSVQFDD